MGSGYKSFTQLMWKHLFFRDGYNLFIDGSCHGVSSVRPRSRICPSRKSVGVPRGYAPLVAGRMSEKGRQGAERPLEGGRRSAFPSKDTFPPVGNPFRCGRCGGAPRATHPLFKRKLPKSRKKKCLQSVLAYRFTEKKDR